MNAPPYIPLPVVIVPVFDLKDRLTKHQSAKYLVSSLIRNSFGGRIILVRNSKEPIFRSPRTNVKEIYLGYNLTKEDGIEMSDVERIFMENLIEWAMVESRQWLVVMIPTGLALRGIEHLFPWEKEADFLYDAESKALSDATNSILELGIFGIRGEALPSLISTWNKEGNTWKAIIEGWHGIKNTLEWGEVVGIHPDKLNWQSLSSAAIIMLQGWPEEERKSATRSLYLGLCMGSQMEIMLHLLEM